MGVNDKEKDYLYIPVDSLKKVEWKIKMIFENKKYIHLI
jgi:hypothetical protein